MNLKSVWAVMALATLVTSCYYDNAEDVYQNFPDDCDLSAVSYSLDVAPVIDNQCVSCHGPNVQQGGLDLSTYEKLRDNAPKVRNRINKSLGDPLLMPPNGPMIKCSIDQINAWIDQGSLNN